MICPYCNYDRGRPEELDLGDLMDHVVDRHPKEFIKTVREMMKEQAIELTDVEFQEGNGGT